MTTAYLDHAPTIEDVADWLTPEKLTLWVSPSRPGVDAAFHHVMRLLVNTGALEHATIRRANGQQEISLPGETRICFRWLPFAQGFRADRLIVDGWDTLTDDQRGNLAVSVLPDGDLVTLNRW